MEVGGYGIGVRPGTSRQVTSNKGVWFQSEGVGEGHWYHVVWGYVINLEFASWGRGGRSATRVASV